MPIPNYDRWKLDDGIGIEKVACKCEGCNEDIYVGHEAFKTDDGLFCEKDCFIDWCIEGYSAREVYVEEGDY